MLSTISRRMFLGTALAGFAASQLQADEVAEFPPVLDDPPFKPATLFLTWQTDPTTTMTVQWVGAVGETADVTVYYSESPTGPWKRQTTTLRAFGQTDLKVFRAQLTKLQPDTLYHFRIGTNSPAYRFHTMPANGTNDITFISGGDVSINSHSIANNIQAARQNPMFVVIGGDLGYDNGVSADICLAFLRNYSQHMIARDGRLIPLLATLGNHEVNGGYLQPRENAALFFSLFDGLYPENSYNTLDFGDYLSLVLLDSGHVSDIGGAQADWLQTTLKSRVDHPNVLVVNHVPAYPSFRKTAESYGIKGTGEGNRQHWTPLFDKFRVPVVLEHHDHVFKRTKKLINGMSDENGVLYLGDGSWGKLRAPQNPDDLPYLHDAQHDYHLSLHRIEGKERFHLAMDEFGRVMDVTRSSQRTIGSISMSMPRMRSGSHARWPSPTQS